MDVMLVGGISPMIRKLSLKLHKEGHKIYILTGSRDPGEHYEHVFERYDFPFDSASVGEVFQSVNPDVTILCGAFDGNYPGKDVKREAIQFAAGLQNILLSWSVLEKGRLVFLSSVEVYGRSFETPVKEGIRPMPRGVRPLMIYQGEESCRFYQEQLKKDVLILRLDRLYDVPKDQREAEFGICQKKCLDAFQNGVISYRRNHKYGLTYLGDAVESIYQVAFSEKHRYGIYHISSSTVYSEQQIAKYVARHLGKELEIVDNTLDDPDMVVLSNERLREEFGFWVKCTPEESIQNTLQYMKKHSGRFLNESHTGWDFWHRAYFKIRKLLGALVPYLENLILFIPFFMLNNRGTDSQYFSKIDFYLIYVLIFAVVHGQRQATFSALLALGGYVFRQMYDQSGIAVVTDYNTYVWVAEIFIVGLVVGYMKDQLKFISEEKKEEVDFLAERVTDIGDINDSNLRVKEGLITQVVNYDFSLGTVYDLVEQMEHYHPAKILFQALTLIGKVMNCRDVAIYRIRENEKAKLFGSTSEKAASLGRSLKLSEVPTLYEAFSRQEVYLNRDMTPEYPTMAYCICNEDQMELMVLLWGLPFERMTIDESDRLIVFSKLIQKSVKQSAAYYNLLKKEHSKDRGMAIGAEVFEELLDIYQEAGRNHLTEYALIQLEVSEAEREEAERRTAELLRRTDYIGYRSDGNLYLLLAGANGAECELLRKSLEQKGIHTILCEGCEV